MKFPLDVFMILYASCGWLIFNNEVANKSVSPAKRWEQKYLDTIGHLKIKLHVITALAK